jgi:Uma2 family endonuclease
MMFDAAELRLPCRRAYRMAMVLKPPASLPGPYVTAEQLRQLPDDGYRYECVAGELFVTPSPNWSHQEIVGRLHLALAQYLAREPVGVVMLSPADISPAPDTLVQPDLFVVPRADAAARQWQAVRHLLLAVEVLSPSTARADRFAKRRLFQTWGVPAYWILDADAQAVEVWTPELRLPVVERQRVSWRPDGAGEALVVELAALFGAG